MLFARIVNRQRRVRALSDLAPENVSLANGLNSRQDSAKASFPFIHWYTRYSE
jgi:hypothetical protein